MERLSDVGINRCVNLQLHPPPASHGQAPGPSELRRTRQWSMQRLWRLPRVGQRKGAVVGILDKGGLQDSEIKAQRSEPRRSHKGPRCTQFCTKSLLEKKQPPGSPSVCSSAGGVKDAQRAVGPGSGPNHATHVSGALGRSVLRRFI